MVESLPFSGSVGCDERHDVSSVTSVRYFAFIDINAQLFRGISVVTLNGDTADVAVADLSCCVIVAVLRHDVTRIFDVNAHRVVLLRRFFIIFDNSAI